MKPEEFEAKLNKLRSGLIAALPDINERMALDCTAQIKYRVINTGVDAKGRSFGKYSTNEVPLYFYKDGSLRAPFSDPINNDGETFFLKVQEENKKRRKKGEDPRGISYEQWRKANNRPVDHITMSFTGETMRDTGPVKTVVSGTKVVTRVGAKNTKSRKDGTTTETVMDGLGDRYGNYLEPNEVETERMKKILIESFQKLLHESFK